MNAAHHMLTFACAKPGSNKRFWLVLFFVYLYNSYRTMSINRTTGQACTGSEQLIIHGWARNAPSLTLPDGLLILH